MNNKHVVVIIPVHNQLHFTQQCLQKVLTSHGSYANCSFSVLVIDDCSTDDTWNWLQWFQKNVVPIEILRNEKNLGFAKTCNRGMLHVKDRCDHVILLNNDTVPRPGFIFTMVQVAESDDKIAVVGAKILKPNTNLIYHTGVSCENGKHVDRYTHRFDRETPQKMIEPRLWVNGCCMLIKTSVIKEFGVFDEKTFSPCYFEEADYCVRLLKAGYKVVYNPTTKIEHYQRQTTIHMEGMSEHFYKNWEKFWKRHHKYIEDKNNSQNCGPRVNIIMPAYNSAQYIQKTIMAILAQTYTNFKLIVIDDHSTDNTVEIVAKLIDAQNKKNNDRKMMLGPTNLEKNASIRLVQLSKNENVAMARNRGLTVLEPDCELVAFCDSDDLWKPHHLEELILQLQKLNKNATKDNRFHMIYSKRDYIDLNGNPMIPYGIPDPIKFDKELLKIKNFIFISGVLITKEAVMKIGGFDPRLNGIEDWDYWYRVSQKYKIYQHGRKTFAYVVRGEKSMAGSNNAEKLVILQNKINGIDQSNILFKTSVQKSIDTKKMKSNKKKSSQKEKIKIVQVQDKKTGLYMKINAITGDIIKKKKSKGPYKNIEIQK